MDFTMAFFFRYLVILFLFSFNGYSTLSAQSSTPEFNYELSFDESTDHQYHVRLETTGWTEDTITFHLPNWTPGYYQIMNFGKMLRNFSAHNEHDEVLEFIQIDDNSYRISKGKSKTISITYDVVTFRKFVANSYVDSAHAFIIPSNTFLYVDHYLNLPVTVSVNPGENWTDVATGLKKIEKHHFLASDFDILYDSPLLVGNLERLPSFDVKGVKHHFVGYDIGEFDHESFIDKLSKVIASSVDIIGDIPFDEYTFIAIGPGRGGIEHLNNTVFSFSGNGLENPERMNSMLNFLTHEYFHHYNVKRIRPFELGPFDYQKENRTNMLWMSEGFTVYYEFLIVKRSGVADEKTLFANFERDINGNENNPGRLHQSLVNASYNTWKDGPFGKSGLEKNKTISYYQKGPIIGLILDFAIRNATENKASLDDVMRLLYTSFYQEKQRGFTDAEFQYACQQIAGNPLNDVFDYVYSVKEIDYDKYLNYAGLRLVLNSDDPANKVYSIERLENLNPLQRKILESWMGE
ncbi:peptidase M61 [Portibacter lacus]|uniref:Peptidase M61 n=2 Tax=Portibacter lacus TaxID=1099794 RepID=A0AA37SRE1_9BACT|nr:peptidase M61 [Portibacter lacus]